MCFGGRGIVTHSRYSTSKGRHNISFWFQHTRWHCCSPSVIADLIGNLTLSVAGHSAKCRRCDIFARTATVLGHSALPALQVSPFCHTRYVLFTHYAGFSGNGRQDWAPVRCPGLSEPVAARGRVNGGTATSGR